MNADLLAVFEFWEREKGINRETLLAAVQEALLAAAKKAVGPARELRVQIDAKSGDIKAFAKMASLATVAGVRDGGVKIHTPLIKLSKAQIIKKGLALGVLEPAGLCAERLQNHR